MAEELITVGTDRERVLTGVGVLRARLNDDEEIVNVYPHMFAEGYLHFGIMGSVTGLLYSMENADHVLAEIEAELTSSSSEELRFLAITHNILEGGQYTASCPTAISQRRWDAMLTVAEAILLKFADYGEITPEKALAYLEAFAWQRFNE